MLPSKSFFLKQATQKNATLLSKIQTVSDDMVNV